MSKTSNSLRGDVHFIYPCMETVMGYLRVGIDGRWGLFHTWICKAQEADGYL
jgi:hypothetical protein